MLQNSALKEEGRGEQIADSYVLGQSATISIGFLVLLLAVLQSPGGKVGENDFSSFYYMHCIIQESVSITYAVKKRKGKCHRGR